MKRSKKSLHHQYTYYGLALILFGIVFAIKVLPLSFVGHNFATRGLQYAAAVVGMSAGVAPNPINTLAAELQAKDAELTTRESDLAHREVVQQDTAAQQQTQGTILTILMLVLAGFVALNFYLDYRRGVA